MVRAGLNTVVPGAFGAELDAVAHRACALSDKAKQVKLKFRKKAGADSDAAASNNANPSSSSAPSTEAASAAALLGSSKAPPGSGAVALATATMDEVDKREKNLTRQSGKLHIHDLSFSPNDLLLSEEAFPELREGDLVTLSPELNPDRKVSGPLARWLADAS
jgi:hypothetical protein